MSPTSTTTRTDTYTYTRVDVGKTFESFRSNLRMVANTSGCGVESVDTWADDVLTLAYAGYLVSVSVVLLSANGERLRAAKFLISEDAGGWASEMPGDNVWPRTGGGRISLILSYSKAWASLSTERQTKFKESLAVKWVPTDQDTTFADMETGGTRRYASNAYGLEQTTFRQRGEK